MAAYATFADMNDWINGLTNQHETVLEAMLETASRSIDHRCQRTFGVTGSEARLFDADDCGDVEFGSYNDAATITEVAIDVYGTGTYAQVWTEGTHYRAVRQDGPDPAATRPYVRLERTGIYTWPYAPAWPLTARIPGVRVTGTWGWLAVPESIKRATIMLAARRWKRRDSPDGVVGWTDTGVVRVSRWDPDIDELIAPYMHPDGTVLVA